MNRGLAIYEGKIFVPVIDGRLDALDAETGKALWESRVTYTQDNYTLTMAPRIARGKVLVGVSGAEYPVRGFIAAYDANTGRQAWKFYTVPGGRHEARKTKRYAQGRSYLGSSFLPRSAREARCGFHFPYDPDSNLIYFGTGNAGAMAGRSSQRKRRRQFVTCVRLSPWMPIRANINGISRWFRATPGITIACSS